MNSGDPVDVSVIIPAYRADATIERALRSVLDQRFEGTFETILVSSADGPDGHPELPDDPALHVVRFDSRMPAAVARNAGADVASGRFLAFTDADAIAHPEWLARLVRASREGELAVGGGIVNGTPRHLVGSAEYLLEFSDQHPARPASGAWHAATVNFLLPLPLWLKYGPWPSDMGGGEDTWMSLRLRADGLFAFCGDATVTHLNRTKVREVMRRQYDQGRHAAEIARRVGHPLRPLLRIPPLAPVAMIARLLTAFGRVAGWAPELWGTLLLGLPVVLLGLTSWMVGLATHGALLDVRSLKRR